jgi:endonuclease V-like protein UPF0215 family
MRVHPAKKGIRALGIAESFVKGESEKAVLAGVVMRGDLQVDGFAVTHIEVGGLDATEGVLRLFRDLDRTDINVIILNGCIISLFNMVDMRALFEDLECPVICVTYEESEGLESYLDELDDHKRRHAIYRSLGDRTPVTLKTGHEVLVRFLGMEATDAKGILNRFTLQGSVPEPLKVARLLARTLLRGGY